MEKQPKDRGLSLIQANQHAEDMFARMRHALIPGIGPRNASAPVRKRETRARAQAALGLRITLSILIFSFAGMMFANRDRLLASFGYEGVPALPIPGAALDNDDQALYWTYALYDVAKLRSRFGLRGYYAIDAARARRNLDGLLNSVSLATLGEISRYAPVAFPSVPRSKP